MQRSIFYGGLTFTCITGMVINTYRHNGYDNIKDFFSNMFNESNILFMSALGALQIKCFDALANKYLEN
jgi:hypothetical protein